MGVVLFFLGAAIAFVGGLWVLILAFKESILWGIGCLIIPFVSLIFVFMHWNEAKKPFLISLAGSVIMWIGSAMMTG